MTKDPSLPKLVRRLSCKPKITTSPPEQNMCNNIRQETNNKSASSFLRLCLKNCCKIIYWFLIVTCALHFLLHSKQTLRTPLQEAFPLAVLKAPSSVFTLIQFEMGGYINHLIHVIDPPQLVHAAIHIFLLHSHLFTSSITLQYLNYIFPFI